MAIRAKLKPLTNEERIQQSNTFLKNFSERQDKYANRVNRRRSLTKLVMNSFSVDANEVHKDVVKHTQIGNQTWWQAASAGKPSPAGLEAAHQHQFLKAPATQRKAKKVAAARKTAEQSEIVGWQQISEEQNANSDFEAIALDSGPQDSPQFKPAAQVKKLIRLDKPGRRGSSTSANVRPALEPSTPRSRGILDSPETRKGSVTNARLLASGGEQSAQNYLAPVNESSAVKKGP